MSTGTVPSDLPPSCTSTRRFCFPRVLYRVLIVYFGVCPPHGGGIKYLGMGVISLIFCDSPLPFLRASEEVE